MDRTFFSMRETTTYCTWSSRASQSIEGRLHCRYPDGRVAPSSCKRKPRTLSRASREGCPTSPCSLHEPIKALCALTGFPSLCIRPQVLPH
jgi:hypothetical protein